MAKSASAAVDPSIQPPPPRPERMEQEPVPPLPVVDESNADQASVTYSHYRTGLSHHRTELSEHRTDLSEHRTDLSTWRTHLSSERTAMSMRRTGMSFQRTRMSADRTLMSVVRTALSLIGFGFTIYQAFSRLRDTGVIRHAQEPRNFGLALVLLGVAVLVVGLIQNVRFEVELRHTRKAMKEEGLVYGETQFPESYVSAVAFVLLILGFAAAVSMIFNIGPF